jgi:hypothetical protein
MPRPLEEIPGTVHDDAVYGTDRNSWHGDEAPEAAGKSNLFLTIILFGATGDLARKKTFPSIASLYLRGCDPLVRLVDGGQDVSICFCVQNNPHPHMHYSQQRYAQDCCCLFTEVAIKIIF